MAPAGWTGNVDSDGRMLTICNNTAIAQAMAFHRYPIRGNGQSTSLYPHEFTVPTVNLNVAYDWDNMLNSYTRANPGTEQQQNAVATLMYHVAAARGTITGNNIPLVMVTNFGYDRSIQSLERRFYTDAEWEAMVRQQLDAKLPVIHRGADPESGHHWVIDGYDNTGRFHINWGWGGASDGWYSLSNFNPRGTRKYYNEQRMYINIKPNAGGVGSNEMGLETFTANKTSIQQNELLIVSTQLRSFGFFSGGQAGVALVDNNGRIAEVIGSRNLSERNPGSGWAAQEIIGLVPETVNVGQYSLRIVAKPEGGDWKIVTVSDISNNVPNSINLTVTAGETSSGGYEMALTTFAPSKTTVSRNERFTVSIAIRNFSVNTFPGGQAGVALVDNNGDIVAIIGTQSFRERDPGSASGIGEASSIVPPTVPPGQYQLRVVIRPTGEEEWRLATLALPDVPTSIPFTVE
jgi:hypothetical protein